MIYTSYLTIDNLIDKEKNTFPRSEQELSEITSADNLKRFRTCAYC